MMEFHIDMKGLVPDLAAIGDAVGELDAAAVIDIEAGDGRLRVATSLSMRDLQQVLLQAGYPLDTGEMVQLPSVCCGGCSG